MSDDKWLQREKATQLDKIKELIEKEIEDTDGHLREDFRDGSFDSIFLPAYSLSTLWLEKIKSNPQLNQDSHEYYSIRYFELMRSLLKTLKLIRRYPGEKWEKLQALMLKPPEGNIRDHRKNALIEYCVDIYENAVNPDLMSICRETIDELCHLMPDPIYTDPRKLYTAIRNSGMI